MMQGCAEKAGPAKMRASGEDYLEAILILRQKNAGVRAVDLARHMGFSKPSITWAVNHLREGGYITLDNDRHLHLTDAGRAIAERVYERHLFFTSLLMAAGVDEQLAAEDACGIEHAISQESFEKLRAYLQDACGSANASA